MGSVVDRGTELSHRDGSTAAQPKDDAGQTAGSSDLNQVIYTLISSSPNYLKARAVKAVCHRVTEGKCQGTSLCLVTRQQLPHGTWGGGWKDIHESHEVTQVCTGLRGIQRPEVSEARDRKCRRPTHTV